MTPHSLDRALVVTFVHSSLDTIRNYDLMFLFSAPLNFHMLSTPAWIEYLWKKFKYFACLSEADSASR